VAESLSSPKFAHGGVVRLTRRELTDQKLSRHSRGELTPLGKRRGTILLEYIPAVEMSLLIEMVVD